MRLARVGALVALAVLLAVAVASGLESASSSAVASHRRIRVGVQRNSSLTGIHKIRHVVIIMQENRSFDNYFGTYPHADGILGLGPPWVGAVHT